MKGGNLLTKIAGNDLTSALDSLKVGGDVRYVLNIV